MPEWILKYWVEWQFGGVITALSIAYKRMADKHKAEKQKQEALCNGMRAVLKDDIIRQYEAYMEKQCLPIPAREHLEDMYEAYRALGGNGTVTAQMEQLRKLPTEPYRCEEE